MQTSLILNFSFMNEVNESYLPQTEAIESALQAMRDGIEAKTVEALEAETVEAETAE